MSKFVVSLERLFRLCSDLRSNQKLIILQQIAKEVNALGGHAAVLRPDSSHREGSKDLILAPDLNRYLLHALKELPTRTTDTNTARTRRALGKILAAWRGRRTFVDLTVYPTTSNPWSKTTYDTHTNLLKLEHFAQRDFAISLNPSHPGAKRLYDATALINKNGLLTVELTFGYPRDSSSWTVRHYDDSREATEWATLAGKLIQRPDEDGPVALARIVDEIQRVLVPLSKNEAAWCHRPAEEHRLTLLREEHYSSYRDRLPSGISHFREVPADTGTRARFGEIAADPLALRDQIASMLADVTCGDPVSEAELLILADGLKVMRRFTPANQHARTFAASLSNRHYGAIGDGPQPMPGPDYGALDACLAEAANQRGRALAWIPRAPHGKGLMPVPCSHIRFNRRTNRITYRGRTMDVGEIRQVDCLPPVDLR